MVLAQALGFHIVNLVTNDTQPNTNKNMNAIDLAKITNATGQFVSVSFKSTKKPASAFKGTVLEKVSNGVFRAGINFANLSSVKESIAQGERGEVQSLPWGEWVQFPYTIAHKGEQYVRLYPAVNAKVEVTYFVNGVSVNKDEFNSFLTPSDAKPSEKPLECFTVKASNILAIG